MSPAYLIASKEAGELLLGVRGLIWLIAVTLALSVFGFLLVSNAELSLLDNAQVVYDMASIITALGSLLPLLLTPVSRNAILAGKLGGIAIAWAVIYLLSLPTVAALSLGGRQHRPEYGGQHGCHGAARHPGCPRVRLFWHGPRRRCWNNSHSALIGACCPRRLGKPARARRKPVAIIDRQDLRRREPVFSGRQCL